MLKELADLAARENMVQDPDFERKLVSWIISLDRSGRYIGLQRTQGKKVNEREGPKEFWVPRGTHSNKVEALFLVDNAKYVYGRPAEKDPNPDRAKECATAFKSLILEAAESTRDDALKAVAAFLDDRGALQKCLGETGTDLKGNDLFAFQVAGELVHDREKVRAWWKVRRFTSSSTEVGQCLVTGRRGPLADLHVDIKGVPGPSRAGAPLVSFNQNAFESYGFRGNDNAPVSQEAAIAYGTALNRLLQNPARRVEVGENTVAVFWARGENPVIDSFAALLTGNADEVKAAYESVWKGREVAGVDPSLFFSLILSGVSKGRISVRSWLVSTVGEAVAHLKRYFSDLEITGRDPGRLPLWALLKSMAPLGESKRLAPDVAQRIYEAALFGKKFPAVVLDAAVRRCRVEHGITRERAALIKACLIRQGKEVKPNMDENNPNPGYILGRLFAELEAMQWYALGDLGASIVDRYFGAACATPQAVFPRLMKVEMHHFRKAREDKPGAANAVQKRIDALCATLEGTLGAPVKKIEGRVEGFPRFLPLDQQGQFVLGYHCQRHHNTAAAAAAKEQQASKPGKEN